METVSGANTVSTMSGDYKTVYSGPKDKKSPKAKRFKKLAKKFKLETLEC